MTDCVCIKKLPDLGCLSEGIFFIIKKQYGVAIATAIKSEMKSGCMISK